MKQFFLKTTLFIFAFTFYNCEKNDPQKQLPPITQNGANTFGAIVDGRIFKPANSFSTTPGTPEFKGLQVYVGNDFKNNNGDDKWTILTGNFKINPSIYIYTRCAF